MEIRQYEVIDIWLAGFTLTILLQIKFNPVLRNNRVVFLYPADNALYRALAAFNAGEAEFSQAILKLISPKEKIESFTPSQIQAKLREAGIDRNSGWQGYERAKSLIFGNAQIDSSTYDHHIKAICDFLGL